MLPADRAVSKNDLSLSLSRIARPLARPVMKVPAVKSKSKLHPKNEENQRNLGKYKGELSLMQLATIQNLTKGYLGRNGSHLDSFIFTFVVFAFKQ